MGRGGINVRPINHKSVDNKIESFASKSTNAENEKSLLKLKQNNKRRNQEIIMINNCSQTDKPPISNKNTETELTIESINCFDLEICALKNENVELKEELERLKVLQKEQQSEIESLKSKVDVVKKKHELAENIVQYNTKLREEVFILRKKLVDYEKVAISSEKLREEKLKLEEQLSATKNLIKQDQTLTEQIANLQDELAVANKTIDRLKNIVGQIDHRSEKQVSNEGKSLTEHNRRTVHPDSKNLRTIYNENATGNKRARFNPHQDSDRMADKTHQRNIGRSTHFYSHSGRSNYSSYRGSKAYSKRHGSQDRYRKY